jgi:CPA2 family monovalent cation:H+ antiporter-2
VLSTVAIITVGKTIAAFVIVRAFGRPNSTALTISASLAQIGEFSFILAGLGVSMGVLPTEGRDLILAGAIISILLNPFLFVIFERLRSRSMPTKPAIAAPVPAPAPTLKVPDEEAVPLATSSLTGHDIVIGYGRVGSLVGSGLRAAGHPVLVFEERVDEIAAARRDGAEVVVGNAADPQVLVAANLPSARRLFVTVPEAFEAGQVVEQARSANPNLEIVARAHSTAAVGHLEDLGCSLAVMGEHEIAMRMLEHAGVDEAAVGRAP